MIDEAELQEIENNYVSWTSLIERYQEINATRNLPLMHFDLRVAKTVFEACNKAIIDFKHNKIYWRTIAAPTGGGKTTAGIAYVAALVRNSHSALILVNTRQDCNEIYDTIAKLLPGKVAVRTRDHDKDELKLRGDDYILEIENNRGYRPSAFFHRAELDKFPALIGTHNGYKSHPDELLKLQDGSRRTLILVDERPDEIDIADFGLADFERLHELCQSKLKVDQDGVEPQLTAALGEAGKQLAVIQNSIDRSKPYHALRLGMDFTLLATLRDLSANRGKCERLAKGTHLDAATVSQMAKLIVLAQATTGYAFTAINVQHTHGARFVAYETSWPLEAGTVLLDATSNIDGYSYLSTSRIPEEAPEANYRQLEACHLEGPDYITGVSPKKLWTAKDTRKPLQNWMHRSIMENSKPNEQILILSWKDVIDSDHLQAMDWGDRRVSFCYFGNGIGSNRWRECTAVFMFGTYIKPARVTIGETHGIKKTPFYETKDATIRGLSGDYSILQLGLKLLWFKQLAMRGCARELDANGIASPMRLYFSTENPKDIYSNWELMFPNAPTPSSLYVDSPEQLVVGQKKRRTSVANDIIVYLLKTDRTSVSSSQLLEDIKLDLKNNIGNLRKNEEFQSDLERHGWELESKRGRGHELTFNKVIKV